jgi:TolB-like protein/Tfp pilus assembly protein PilF
MPEQKSDLHLEIAHVLFMDVVGYSKLLVDEQSDLSRQLNQIVRGTEQFRAAEAAGKLVRLPTGDGMALAFFSSPDEPVRCAMEISQALKSYPKLALRMGIHSGPVDPVADVNDRSNVAGAGINLAQRVMNCGDAGHILLSKRVAEDLSQFGRWQPHLHELEEIEVKHGVKIPVVNLYTDEIGNPALPQKLLTAHEQAANRAISSRRQKLKWTAIAALSILALGLGSYVYSRIAAAKMRAAAIPEKSIAVLPFQNRSANEENAFFTEGVQDEILTHLAKVADLKVISRTSVMHYKPSLARNLREIAQQLGVAHVLEGSVQRTGEKVRVIAQLIDARNNAQLWGNTYDRNLADVFAIQSEIARTIAEQLRVKLSPTEKIAIEKPPTIDLAAYDLYTRAKSLIAAITYGTRVKENLLEAAHLLDQAVARDPSFLVGYCQLALVHDFLYFLGHEHTPERLALGDHAVESAIRLQPDSGEAHLALAIHRYRGYRDYDRARAELALARETLTNDPRVFELIGYIDRRQGKHEEGLRNLERALELDPRNFVTLQQISHSYHVARRYEQMANVLDRALEIKPDDIDIRTARAAVDLYWRADTQPLRQTIESILKQNPAAAESVAASWLLLALCERDATDAGRALVALGENNWDSAVPLGPRFAEGLIARFTNDDAKARAAFTTARAEQEKVLKAQPEDGPAYCVLGLIDAGLGRKEDALRAGRRAMELLPLEKDSLNGAWMIEYFGIIAAWVGEKDLAFEHLKRAAQLPGGVSYGVLKLHPFWNPLRGDPRFDQVLASLAPK